MSIRRSGWEYLEPSVCGWGINDVTYKVHIHEELPKLNGKRKSRVVWRCPYYSKWCGMIRRVHSADTHKLRPNYKNTEIDSKWKYFSEFISWVDSQPNKNWINCSLDKDLLGNGFLYSEKTCVFIPSPLNSFAEDRKNDRGNLMLGVTTCLGSKINKYQAQISDPFTLENCYLGLFPTEFEAHKAWQAKKHEYACKLADLQDDPRVADALRQRYAPDKDWSKR